MSRSSILAAALATTLLASISALARDKIDVVSLSNGDRVTGEIKQLAAGELEIKTHLMDTVHVEWVGVVSVSSGQLFQVEDAAGRRFDGTLGEGTRNGEIVVAGSWGQVTLATTDVVEIIQLEERRWDRWNGHVNLGFSLASANAATTLSLDSAVTYRSHAVTFNNSLTTMFSDRDDSSRTWRSQLTSNYRRTISGDVFWVGLGALENNQELGLDLRVTAGLGAGSYFIRTSSSELSLTGALTGNREAYNGEDLGGWNLEALVMTDYELFLFGRKKTLLSISFGVLPSLTSWGRIRLELNASFSRKITSDLTISVSLYDSYDNDPPTEDVPSNDWGTTTSLGWTF